MRLYRSFRSPAWTPPKLPKERHLLFNLRSRPKQVSLNFSQGAGSGPSSSRVRFQTKIEMKTQAFSIEEPIAPRPVQADVAPPLTNRRPGIAEKAFGRPRGFLGNRFVYAVISQ